MYHLIFLFLVATAGTKSPQVSNGLHLAYLYPVRLLGLIFEIVLALVIDRTHCTVVELGSFR